MKRGGFLICATLLANYAFEAEALADAEGGGDFLKPDVAIVQPERKATFDAPATVHVVVEATDPSGEYPASGIRSVGISANGGEAQFVYEAPYEFDLELEEGMYILVATADDNAGNSSESPGVEIAVFPGGGGGGSESGEATSSDSSSSGCAVSRPRPREAWTAGLAFGIAVFAGVMLRRRREQS